MNMFIHANETSVVAVVVVSLFTEIGQQSGLWQQRFLFQSMCMDLSLQSHPGFFCVWHLVCQCISGQLSSIVGSCGGVNDGLGFGVINKSVIDNEARHKECTYDVTAFVIYNEYTTS